MNQHDIIVKEQEVAEKKMELEKTAFEEAAKECSQKKEECDKIRSELSSSFSDAAQSLAKNQGEQIRFLIHVKSFLKKWKRTRVTNATSASKNTTRLIAISAFSSAAIQPAKNA